MSRARLLAGVVVALTLGALLPLGEAKGPLIVAFTGPSHKVVGETAVLSGVVRAPLNAAPLPATTVDLLQDGTLVGSTLTSPTGAFSFTVLQTTRGLRAYEAVVHRVAGDPVRSTGGPVLVSWAVPPGAPPAPAATPASDAKSFTLVWGLPADDGGAPITSYTILRAPGPEGPWITVATSNTRSAHVDGLAWQTPYAFAVQAHNLAGAGPRGAPLALVTPAPVPPGPVEGATFTWSAPFAPAYPRGDISWSPPPAPGNGRLDGYRVELSTNGGPYATLARYDPLERSQSLSVLYGRTYTARITPATTAGEGPPTLVTLTMPSRHGVDIRTDRLEVCQTWPLHLLCRAVGPGETLLVHDATTTIRVIGYGDVFANDDPVNGAAISTTGTLTAPGVSHTENRPRTSASDGTYWTYTEEISVPNQAHGVCVDYTATLTASVGTQSDADTLVARLCSTGPPPP